MKTFSIGFARGGLRRAAVRAAGGRALRHRPPRDRRRGPTPSRPRRHRLPLRRAVRRPLGHADVLVCREARRHVKVCCRATAATSSSAGYTRYRLARRVPAVRPPLRRRGRRARVAGRAGHARAPWGVEVSSNVSRPLGASRYFFKWRRSSYEERRALLGGRFARPP